jgi:hypothetical protein
MLDAMTPKAREAYLYSRLRRIETPVRCSRSSLKMQRL